MSNFMRVNGCLRIAAMALFLTCGAAGCSDMMDQYLDMSNPFLYPDGPVVAFANLRNYQRLDGPQDIIGTAYSGAGIESVRISIDGNTYDTWSTDEYQTWHFDDIEPYLTEGIHEVTAVATDFFNRQARSALIIFYRDGFDLYPSDIDVSGTTFNAEEMNINGTVNVEVANSSGYDITGTFSVVLFEDSNQSGFFDSEEDRIMGTALMNGLAAGGSSTLSFAVDSPVVFRDNLIYAFVDADFAVDETDEENNLSSNMANCNYVPPPGSFDPILEWRWSESDILPGSDEVMGAPVVANLNDDNGDGRVNSNDIPDIIFVTFEVYCYDGNGALRAISGDGKGELFTVTDYEVEPTHCPAVGDIDGDGLPEIVAMEAQVSISTPRRIMAFENDGTHKWTSEVLSPFVTGAVALVNVDQSGLPEVIVGDLVFNSLDGSLLWDGDYGNGIGVSTIANIDLVGNPEVVAGNSVYRSDGSLLWQNTAVDDGYTAIGNFDEDPYPEIVCSSRYSSTTGNVWLMEHDGALKWGPVTMTYGGTTSQRVGPPTVADVDNDGEPEIGVAGKEHFFVLETDGSIKWASPIQELSSGLTGSSVFDFEGDGSAELIYADERYLRIYRGIDGEVIFETPIGSGTRIELPVIVDVDNDNRSEVVVVGNRLFSNPDGLWGIHVFGDANDTWVNTRKIWNQHSYHITNVNDDGTIPEIEDDNWGIYNNFRQNQLLEPFSCADLSVSYVRVDTSNCPEYMEITARVGNSGASAINRSINVAFYSGDPDDGGALLGTKYINDRLEPGAYQDVTFSSHSAVPESCVIYVRADDDGDGRNPIREVNEDNNVGSLAVNIPGGCGSGGTGTPSGGFVINDDDGYAQSWDAMLSMDVTDAVSMRFSNDCITWTGWEDYAAVKEWQLLSGGGIKTVYGEFRHFNGNIIRRSDTIILLEGNIITPPDGNQDDLFGTGVSVSSEGNTVTATGGGLLYIYDRSDENWAQTAIITSDSVALGRGVAVSFDGNTAAAGAPGDSLNGSLSGSVYLFKRNGGAWDEVKVAPADGSEGDEFGSSVALSNNGSYLLAGVPGADNAFTDQGAAYAYVWDGDSWEELARIFADDGSEGDRFGSAVSASSGGETIAVGAPLDDDNGADAGSVYIYRWDEYAYEEHKITAFDGPGGYLFGSSVAVSSDGDTVVIGAPGDDSGRGSIYVYRWDGTGWTGERLIAAGGSAGDEFGFSVSVSIGGLKVVAGAPGYVSHAGSAYLFTWNGMSWDEIILPYVGEADDYFGYSSAISARGGTIVIGAPEDDFGSNSDQGSIVIY